MGYHSQIKNFTLGRTIFNKVRPGHSAFTWIIDGGGHPQVPPAPPPPTPPVDCTGVGCSVVIGPPAHPYRISSISTARLVWHLDDLCPNTPDFVPTSGTVTLARSPGQDTSEEFVWEDIFPLLTPNGLHASAYISTDGMLAGFQLTDPGGEEADQLASNGDPFFGTSGGQMVLPMSGTPTGATGTLSAGDMYILKASTGESLCTGSWTLTIINHGCCNTP